MSSFMEEFKIQENTGDKYVFYSLYEKVLLKIKTEIGLDRCEVLISAGAPLPVEALKFFSSLKLPLLNL